MSVGSALLPYRVAEVNSGAKKCGKRASNWDL